VTPPDVPNQGTGPMAPSAMVGRSTQDEEAQASSDEEVEEIQGILAMDANIFMSGTNVGITGLATRRLRKSRRQTE